VYLNEACETEEKAVKVEPDNDLFEEHLKKYEEEMMNE
jgi:hypothetical protein